MFDSFVFDIGKKNTNADFKLSTIQTQTLFMFSHENNMLKILH